ncbi:MAG: peptidoglycan DD-metalloendopeptidase family protein [Acidimicrobiia bacterium]
MRRLTTLLVASILLVSTAVPALAVGFDPVNILFPLGGEHRLTDSFGDCRGTNCSRRHEGVDIMAAKGVPVYAVADGTITWISPGPSDCCYLGIDHGDGWLTRYIHLNDDAQDADGNYIDYTDGQGWGIADGIVNGSVVTRGQLIGWVGDSGNATETVTHLHFELRKDGTAIDPYDYLVHAEGNWTGVFRDDDYSVHQNNIDKIYAEGITLGCNPPYNDEFCPERNITRGEMAAFLARALNLSAMTGVPAYDDVGGHLFEVAVDKIQTAGIAFGCDTDSFCPDRPLDRYEMAELLVRAFGYENPDGIDFFTDDNGNQFEESINKLAAAGITVGCNPPANDHYCPDRQLTRAEMATFFVRALGL